LREKNERKKNRKFQKQEPHNNYEEKKIKIRASSKKNKTKKFANQQIKVRAFKKSRFKKVNLSEHDALFFCCSVMSVGFWNFIAFL